MTDPVRKAADKTAGGGLGKKAADVITTELRHFAVAIGERAASNVAGRIDGLTNRLSDIASGNGSPGQVAAAAGAEAMAKGKSPMSSALSAGFAGAKEKVKEAVGLGGKGGGGGGKKKIKVTNIIESVDVGVPVRVAYNQWTQFADFPSFMKKVENIDQEADEKMTWKAQVLWSHRTWEATILEQVPDQHIIWRSKGAKGSVDGTVTFHELAPDLTRILLVLEYHPQGLFERTGNIWRAQGRRARLELKHFVRQVMTQTILDPDELEGWRGEIRDSQVVLDHEEAMRREQDEDAADERDEQTDELDEEDAETEEPEEEAEEPGEAPRPQRRPARPRGERPRPARSVTPGRSRR